MAQHPGSSSPMKATSSWGHMISAGAARVCSAMCQEACCVHVCISQPLVLMAPNCMLHHQQSPAFAARYPRAEAQAH